MRSPRKCAALFAQLGLVTVVPTSILSAQGCEPIRFSTPVSLGGQGEAYQREKEWRLTLGYRRLYSNEWFVGTSSNAARGPGGAPPVLNINTVIADIAYAPSERLQLHLSVPVSRATSTSIWPDKLRHTQGATGIGDVSFLAEEWLLSPKSHQTGNLSLGVGLKAPTGSHAALSHIYTPTQTLEYPADQTVQPSDGGWGILLQSQAFRQVTDRLFGYAFGSYMISPQARGKVEFRPGSGVYWSIPDIYSARAGAAFALLPNRGVTLSLGGRMDGIPLRDVLGGGDNDTIKRTSRVMFLDPGVSWTLGRDNITVSMPWRVSVDRFKSLYESRTNTLNGGGFAKHLIFASYSRRF